MSIPDDLKYSREHEWVRVEQNVVRLGITFHAQDQLGDVVYLELPSKGDKIDKDEPFGVVESTKAVSDIYAPITGAVVEVNEALLEEPAPINTAPYEDGWLLRVELEDTKDLEQLMTAQEYADYLKEEA